MKKHSKVAKLPYIVLVLMFCMLTNTQSVNGALFGIDGTLFKKQTTEIKTELSAIREMQMTLSNQISINNNMTAQLQAKMVAVDNSISTKMSAGRDANSNSGNTNDTKLMMNIFRGITGFLSVLLATLVGYIKFKDKLHQKDIEAKEKWISNLLESNSKKDEKADLWMQKFIEKLTENKKNID